MFISFEGPDGAGKTSQIKMLETFLSQEKKQDVLLTREPGGCPLAEKIRGLLLQRDGGDWQKMSEVLLLYAARLEHIETVIKPALKDNKIVITDRFSDSTFAYQGYGHAMGTKEIAEIDRVAINNFTPDLTIILDIDVKKGLERTGKRFEDLGSDDGSTEDRFERMELSFHENLRRGFLEIAQKDPKRCVVIDADRSVEEIHEDIVRLVWSFLDDKSTKISAV